MTRRPRAAPPDHGDSVAPDGDADVMATSVGGGTAEHRAIAFLRRYMRSNAHWRPSPAMAKCLGVPPQRLMLTQRKDDTANLVWVTVLVLLFMSTELAEYHEHWFDLADAALGWLYSQPHFLEHREDLVTSGCSLLNVPDSQGLLMTQFPEPKDDETRALEAQLGDWKICYLEQPPYTMYYWNERTNESTWQNPMEAARVVKEREERQRTRQERLAKFLPQRLAINRDRMPPQVEVPCQACRKAIAHVLCLACNSAYFCDDCCDRLHADSIHLTHIESSFRFIKCAGTRGFRLSEPVASLSTAD